AHLQVSKIRSQTKALPPAHQHQSTKEYRQATGVQQLPSNSSQFSSSTIPGKIDKVAVPPSVGLRSAYPTAGASPTFKTEDPRQTGTESRATGRENPVPPASRRWVPPSLRPQHGLTEEARIDSVFRKVRGILNKLTPEKFQKLSDELLKLDLNSSKILNGVILLIFDKALDEPKYSSMYAQLCKRIQKELETDIDKSKSTTFLQILLNVCRDKFENRVQYSEKIINSESTLTDDLEEKKNVAKQKILGNVKFIGELYKLGMLVEAHLHKMLRSLFTNKSSSSTEKNCEDMECLAQLIRTCGKNLDTELGKQLMDQYFERMEKYSQSQSMFPPRIRFILRDLIELRKNNWTPRKVALVEGPAPIQELNHDDDVLPPGLNHLRNRDRDYRNNDRSEQRDWIGKFSLNLHNLNDGFNLLSVSSSSPLLPSSYNPSSNGYGNRDHRDNGGGGGGGNYRMHNNRNNQNNFGNNNMRYNKHSNHHHPGSGGGMRDGGNGSHASGGYGGNSGMMSNKDLAPRFKRNLMTPPQNPVEELQMRPTPNSLLFKANMNIKPQLPISSSIGGGGASASAKPNFNGPSLGEFPSPLTTRTLLSEQRNAAQISSSAFSTGNNTPGTGMNFGGSGGSSMTSSVAPRGGIQSDNGVGGGNMMSMGRSSGGSQQPSSQTNTPNAMNHRHHQQGPRQMGGNENGSIHSNKPNPDSHQQHHHHHQNQQSMPGSVGDHHGGVREMNGDRLMNHYEPSTLNRPHIDPSIPSVLNSTSASGTPGHGSLVHGSKITQKDQIIKQNSSDKTEKKRKEKGLTKEDHMKRIATFVSDVMLDNIKQQIDEEEQQKHSGVDGKEDVIESKTNDASIMKEVVVEVVDNKENKTEPVSSAPIENESTPLIEDVQPKDDKTTEQDDLVQKEKKIEEDVNGSVDSKEDEKKDIGSETQKDERDATAQDNNQQEQQQLTGASISSTEIAGEAKDFIPPSNPESMELSVEENKPEMKKRSLMEELVHAFCELKIPEKLMREAMIAILNQVLDRNDAFHVKTIDFLQILNKESKLSTSAALESFKSIVNGMNEKEKTIPKITTIIASLLARAVAVNLCGLGDVANFTENGQHYPLFLLVLQHLHKQLGKQPLQELFNKSKVDLMSSLPECDRTKDRMAEILEDRNLNFLYPLLRVQAELWKQIQSDANPQQFYKWIKENVESSCYAETGFIVAIITVLLKYIHQESENLKEDKKRIEKEKEILTKYCPVLNAFLNGNNDLQLTAVYAIQVYWYSIGYPKGVLLRWFQEMYELSVIEEDAFLRYKEDVTDIYPGKGKALFQVNQWLTWLAEAEDEDDDEED
uniref:Eukaryotic translation initiation factor 4 gamma 2 n=1 Tax=Anopheles epiroticus TaxID=199890 RepID=A0A182P600_9DIPT